MTSKVFDTDKRKLLSAVSHGSIFFSPLLLTVGIPIVLLTVSDDPVIRDNAKEAINFHINVWIYGAIAGFISFFWFTLILLPLIWALAAFVFILTWVFPLFAIVSCITHPDQSYRYRYIFRFL
ncbi:DUF4870 domain-containing protein [Lyngbya confervoides]|uniref:DUF4870 domain-containing protein n=1 Tax=Lyngbya confervoides BDU141951 TaxID=1574623 RepID=A0ABD4T6I2_9CYAN|nr:DUF4870 domain-containing protein [Lyngbya confervoides]MCM1984179.1 DUF4870 domain-containing protein [Lyngbya confervoides BDU141951]